jgi:hypothetical protein
MPLDPHACPHRAKEARRCSGCSCWLSSANDTPYCAPCSGGAWLEADAETRTDMAEMRKRPELRALNTQGERDDFMDAVGELMAA